jgi:hypothetical protein
VFFEMKGSRALSAHGKGGKVIGPAFVSVALVIAISASSVSARSYLLA